MVKMLPTILKNLGNRPVTRPYPYVRRDTYHGLKGRLTLDMRECIMCTACEKRCPAGCFEIKRKEGLYKYDPYSCVVCGACVEACPEKCLEVDSEWRKPVEKMETMVWHIEPRKKNEKDA
ncbi:MAG: 4Fe-4S dicluster domain-containing protein [Chitinophagales bacterium]